MIDVAVIQELCRYNEWANGRVFESVSALTDEEFGRDLRCSHRSVRDTLAHIVWAEWIWLRRWKGTSPQIVFQGADFPHCTDLRARWVEVAIEQRAFVDAVTAESLAAVVPYVNLRGETWRYPLWREMWHVVNHSTYHRGQVAAMLRQLGERPVATDFLVFHDERDSAPA